ncbi:MAG: DUF4870 domain-containing protein [Ktedonobacterales bacterium]
MNPQQPQYGSPPPPAAPNRWGPTSLGMEAHIAAGLSYIWIVGLIFFFVEKTNRFVRFHAAQSILLGIASAILWIALTIVDSIIIGAASVSNSAGAAAAGLGVATVLGCVGFLVGLAIFGMFLWGLIAGFMGKYVKFPIIGNIAERWAGGPAMMTP